MTRAEAAEKLYELLYKSFETKGFGAGSILVSRTQMNEVQFKLMKSVASLKDASQPQDEVCNQIIAQVNVAHSLGYVTDETFKEVEKLLGEL